MNALKRVEQLLLDVLFPPICISCKKYLAEGGAPLMCDMCFASIPIHTTAFRDEGMRIGSATSFDAPAVRELVHALKYGRAEGAALVMARVLTKYVERSPVDLDQAVLLPIPLHLKRERERGFNQAERIARALEREIGLPVDTLMMQRTRNTAAQARSHSRTERKKNIRGCFKVDERYIMTRKDTPIILIDDVYTTGATVQEAARTLRGAGAKNIQALVFARVE